MRRLAILLFCTTALAQAPPPVAHYGHDGPAALPDPKVTPGEETGITKDEVCERTWGTDERHVTPKMKDQVCVEYGLKPHCYGRETYEIDHSVPRELGGSDTMRNLWAQSYTEHPGAHEKDNLENKLHRMVCANQISLAEAQREISTDWYAAWLKYVNGR